jgi:transmembrane sensor
VTGTSDRQDQIDTEAAEWAARLTGGPLTDRERRALDRWLDEDPRHATTFAEARTAWAKMGQVELGSSALGRGIRPRRSVGWRQITAMAACLLILFGGAIVWFGDPLVMMEADYRTAPGERRTVTLHDGSTVELGPASAIAVRYDDDERRVELLSGLAYFTASPRQGEERRSFVVAAATGTARALGTQFLVERYSQAVEVTVVEHDVEVTASARDGQGAQVVLSPGQSIRYGEQGLSRVESIALEQALAWRRGRLFFDRVPLDHVVTELGRYRRGRIVIANAALARRTVSGVFDTVDPDAVLATIARELDARVVSAPLITLLY